MGYGICRVQKVKNGFRGIQNHAERIGESKTNPDIDYSKSNENYSLYGSAENLQKRINDRIRSLQLKRAPRSDAVKMLDFIVTATHESMEAMTAEQQKEYFKTAIDFLRDRFGAQNIMYDKVHMDEKTPHMHVGFVPVTKDGRLCADDFMKRGTLHELQNEFYENVSKKFGLERGEVGTKKKHIETARLKEQTAQENAKKAKEYITKISKVAGLRKTDKSVLKKVYDNRKENKGNFFNKKDEVVLSGDDFNKLYNLAYKNIDKALAFDEINEQLDEAKQANNKLQNELSKMIDNDIKKSNKHNEEIYKLTKENEKIKRDAKTFLDVPDFFKDLVKNDIEIERLNFKKEMNQVNIIVGALYLENKETKVPSKKCEYVRKNIDIGFKMSDSYIKSCASNFLKQIKGESKPVPDRNDWSIPKTDNTNYREPVLNGLAKELSRTLNHDVSLPPNVASIPSELQMMFDRWGTLSPEQKKKLLEKYEQGKLI